MKTELRTLLSPFGTINAVKPLPLPPPRERILHKNAVKPVYSGEFAETSYSVLATQITAK
jgi:hypothetical protein